MDPPPPPHNRFDAHKNHTSTSKNLHTYLPMPPAPTTSDLPIDKDLLQRWSTHNSPNGTPSHRSQSHIKRHASFDSPREVPLPSPSFSSLSPGTLSSSALPFFSNINTNLPSSISTTAPNDRANHSSLPAKPQDVADYFPLQPRPNPQQSPSSSSGSSQQSSNASRDGSRRFSDFGSENSRQDRENAHTESDWTSQTSPSPPFCGEDGQKRTSPADPVPGSSHTSQSDVPAARAGLAAMMQSSQPLNPNDTALNGTRTTIATPIFPYARPYSLPDGRSHSKLYANFDNILGPVPTAPTRIPPHQPDIGSSASGSTASPITWPDRNSSASLPLPMQIPYYTLPRAADVSPGEQGGPSAMGSPRAPPGDAGPSRNGTQSHMQTSYPYHHPPPDLPESSSSSSSSSSYGHYNLRSPVIDRPNPRNFPPPVPPVHKATPTNASQKQAQAGRPVSPFRAPQPRPTPGNAYSSASSSSTAMPRPVSSNGGVATYSATAFSSYPAPEPPTILAPSSDGPGQPYDPFLSHAPPPADSWIQVETTQGEYRLNVRLPGFKRDGITLATKKRRILHVVADSWENGGGHFERRISFGYDADLVQVRAEFDGEMLRISIPRRLSPVNLWQTSRPDPIGRSE